MLSAEAELPCRLAPSDFRLSPLSSIVFPGLSASHPSGTTYRPQQTNDHERPSIGRATSARQPLQGRLLPFPSAELIFRLRVSGRLQGSRRPSFGLSLLTSRNRSRQCG